MAKKPVQTKETGASEIAEAEIAVIEPTFTDDLDAVTRSLERAGYVVMTRTDYDDLQMKLKQSR